MAATKETLQRRIAIAAGREQAELVIKNCRVLNVFTEEIISADIAIQDGVIAAVGSYQGDCEVDVSGRYVSPGLIDGHMHLESTMVRPSQFARSAVPHGTLGVIADPHEIANVCGVAGIEFILADSADLPMDVWIMIPSCVPATDFETSGARLDAIDIQPLMAKERVRGLGEMMAYPGVIAGDGAILDKITSIDYGRRQVVDGHSPWVSGLDLAAYAAAGIRTDHECSTVDEMMERLRLGMYVQIREGSACRNLRALIGGVSEAWSRRLLFCTDDKHPEDIAENGHIDNNIRMAVAAGLNPVLAVRMASLNVAECYGLEGVGAIAPGYQANLLVLDDLEGFKVHQAYKNGILVAEDGVADFAAKDFEDPKVLDSVHIRELAAADLAIHLSGNQAWCIGLRPRSVETDKLRQTVTVENGCYANNPDDDLLKMAVIERHRGGGNIGLGLIKGFGLKSGAIASTIAHDSHNLIAVGDNDQDMLTAIEVVRRMSGGIAVVAGGQLTGALALPIAGLMSKQSITDVEQELRAMKEDAYARGVSRDIEPFMTLGFMALPVIPALKLTDRGLFDVLAFSHINIDPCVPLPSMPAACPADKQHSSNSECGKG
ncbi:MAG: adenine deaminase [Actinomycetia bacterium]|nr:adenine deaminase [Actinomycetes bacterium]